MARSRKIEIQVSRSARCEPETVIALVRDPQTWPQWQPEIVSTSGPSPLEPGDDVYGHASMLGFRVEGHSKTAAATATRYEEDVLVGVRMRIVYEVRPDGEGNALLTRRLSALLPGGVAGRLLSFFLKRRLTRMQDGVVDALVTQAEAKG